MRVSFGRSNISAADPMKFGQIPTGNPCRGKGFTRGGHESLHQIIEPASRRRALSLRQYTTHAIQTHYNMI